MQARQQLRTAKAAATRIAAAWRGYAGRRAARAHRRELAATRISAAWRGWQARRVFLAHQARRPHPTTSDGPHLYLAHHMWTSCSSHDKVLTIMALDAGILYACRHLDGLSAWLRKNVTAGSSQCVLVAGGPAGGARAGARARLAHTHCASGRRQSSGGARPRARPRSSKQPGCRCHHPEALPPDAGRQQGASLFLLMPCNSPPRLAQLHVLEIAAWNSPWFGWMGSLAVSSRQQGTMPSQ